jgi:hypothetical protein
MLLLVLFTAVCVMWGCNLMGTTGGDDGPDEDAEEQDDDGIPDGDDSDDDADDDDDGDDDSGSGSGSAFTGTFPGANAYALIDGADFGDGTADVSELRKRISVELSAGTSGNFSVPSELYAMRSSPNSDALFLVIPVTNVSNAAWGGVHVDDIVLLDDDDAPLHSGTLAFRSVQASVFGNEHGIVSNNWLAPNETGCAFVIELYYYPDVAALRCTVQAHYAVKQETNAEVIPQGYTLSGGALIITFANTGTRTVEFDDYLYWVGLDASGMPLLWGLDSEDLVPSNRILAPGESGSITDASVSYRGTIEQIVVFIDYELVG